jgi:glycosyltransferase involved in cell wall biosynthesis
MGLPVFNGEKYLCKALDSLLSQEYEDFELVISDNASTDETGRICESYARRDSRVRYSRNKCNIGMAPNHNRVFCLSRGEFFKWVAYDDEYPPQMLKRYVEAFDASPASVSVVYSVCECIDELGNPQGTKSDHVDKRDARPALRLAHLLQHVSIFNCTYGLIRSAILRKTRLHGSFPMADRVLISELAMLGEFVEIAEPLLRLRIHEHRSLSQHKNAQAIRELFDPANKTKRSFLSIEGRVQLELLRSAWRVPPRLSEKLMCVCAALATSNWRKFKNFGGLQKIKLKRMIAQARGRQTDTAHL